MNSTMRRGKLPDLSIREIKGTHYLVCVFHDNSLRVYYFDRVGRMTEAEEFTGGQGLNLARYFKGN